MLCDKTINEFRKNKQQCSKLQMCIDALIIMRNQDGAFRDIFPSVSVGDFSLFLIPGKKGGGRLGGMEIISFVFVILEETSLFYPSWMSSREILCLSLLVPHPVWPKMLRKVSFFTARSTVVSSPMLTWSWPS